MNEIFHIKECLYSLRKELRFKLRNIPTVKYGIGTAVFIGSRIWSYMLSELIWTTSLNELRSKIKTWKPQNCTCELSKIYLVYILYIVYTLDTVIYVSFFVWLFVLLGFFVCFLLFFPFIFKSQFKVDLN